LSGQCAPTLEGRSGNTEASRAFANGDALHGFELVGRHWLRGTSQPLPLRPSALQARDRAFLQSLAFELAKGRQDCELQLAEPRSSPSFRETKGMFSD
jgi:hypothetical protein